MFTPAFPAPVNAPGVVDAVPSQNAPIVGGICGAPLYSGTKYSQFYIRVAGNNNNGGSSNSLTPDRSGTDGVITNTTKTFTSVTGAFTSADIGKGLAVSTAGSCKRYKIMAITDGTHVILDRIPNTNASSQTWAIGGAWADHRPAWGSSTVCPDGSSPVQPGDIVWVGAGDYRQIIIPGNNLAGQWTNYVTFKGDNSGYNTGDAGQIRCVPWTSDLATGATSIINANSVGISNVIFETHLFGYGTAPVITNFTGIAAQLNWIFRKCVFDQEASELYGTAMLIAPCGMIWPQFYGWVFDRCVMNENGSGYGISATTNTNARAQDWDIGLSFLQCASLGGDFFGNGKTTGVGLPGGIKWLSNTWQQFAGFLQWQISTLWSTKIPSVMYGNLCLNGGGTSNFSANTLGALIEDYNNCTSSLGRSLTPIGPHTNLGSNKTLQINTKMQDWLFGQLPRPMYEPQIGSNAIAFGTKDTSAGVVDMLGHPRPSVASKWTAGCLERWNTGLKTTSIVNDGSNAIVITGFGGHDFDIAVDAVQTTISVYIRYDSNYQGPLPRVEIVNGDGVGVGEYHLPVSKNSLNAFAQYSITINPTQQGVVTLRISSLDTSAANNGNVYADTFAVA